MNRYLSIGFLLAFSFSGLSQFDSILTNENTALETLGAFSIHTTKGGAYIHTIQKENGNYRINVDGEDISISIADNRSTDSIDLKPGLAYLKSGTAHKLIHVSKGDDGSLRVKNIPMWLSLFPPLVAILLALIFKEVVISLAIGIFSGAFIANGMQFLSPIGYFKSFVNILDKYIVTALNDTGHLSVILFSMLIGGMVAIISKNGGMMGVVNVLSKYARDARSSQFITWLLGIAIFFDDYANTLVVGNTMRSVTDKFKISREKLAYIVDSTAAPVSAIAFITTWIGAELGYIGDGMASIDMPDAGSPYAIFLASLKYSFYPILTLIFILILIKTGREYGPMLNAETRARKTGRVSPAATDSDDEPNMEDLTPVPGISHRWPYAAIPVLSLISITFLGLLITGFGSLGDQLKVITGIDNMSWGYTWINMSLTSTEENLGFGSKLGLIIGAADSYKALLWSSLSGVLIAIIMTIGGRKMNLFNTMHWMSVGFKTMIPALIILTLAWSLAITTKELQTAEFLSMALQNNLSPYLIPPLVFILSAFISFSTGSSWSTMAILYPIAIPTTYYVTTAAGLDPEMTYELMLNVISTVLAASVLGDHMSPISDTTILSSLASDCNHINHVRTQLPYALTVGFVSIIGITIAPVLGGSWLINLFLIVLSAIILYVIVLKRGKLVTSATID